MRVLVVCEFSGIVRDAFRRKGIEAFSLDLLPSESPSPYHIQADAKMYFGAFNGRGIHLAITHPPCTHLASSGARWFKGREREQEAALDFVKYLWNLDIPRIALENPIGILSTKFRKPDQIIQPWQFGHPTTKATCLWLKGLPPLRPTKVVEPVRHDVWMESPSPERWKNRSRTYLGIAEAMADQWGGLA